MSKEVVRAIKNLGLCLQNANDTTELQEAIEQTNTLLQELIDATNEQKDYEIVCISDGNETVKGVLQIDSEGNQTIILDGNDVTGTYSQVSCEKTAYDYESKIVCVDGKSWTKTLVYESENDGDPNYVTTIWLDETDVIQSAPDQTLIDNENCADCKGEEIRGIVNDWAGPLPITVSGNVYYDINKLRDNEVDGFQTFLPSGIKAVLVQVNSGTTEVVGVEDIPTTGSNAGKFSFSAFSNKTYYVMLTTETLIIGDLPPSNSSLPGTYQNTGEQIKDSQFGGLVYGQDGEDSVDYLTVDGKSVEFTTGEMDVVGVDFGINLSGIITES